MDIVVRERGSELLGCRSVRGKDRQPDVRPMLYAVTDGCVDRRDISKTVRHCIASVRGCKNQAKSVSRSASNGRHIHGYFRVIWLVPCFLVRLCR